MVTSEHAQVRIRSEELAGGVRRARMAAEARQARKAAEARQAKKAAGTGQPGTGLVMWLRQVTITSRSALSGAKVNWGTR